MATTRGSERLRLQQWLQERHITLHPDLEIEEGRIVAKESIEPKTTVASIPKRVVLSERTTSCDVARISAFPIPSPVRLAVCLLHELSLGSRSPWADYLASLPTETVPIAAVWPADSESRRWILGTEAARLMEETYTDHDTLTQYYTRVVQPFFAKSSSSPSPTLPHFLRAYSLVSSRAFQVDSWLGLSLVPLADIFNHLDDHDVHFESETWVCAECGALDECQHDGGRKVMIRPPMDSAEDDTCDLVSEGRIGAGQEVFNTYGELSNAELLVFYGFALDANKHERVTFSVADIARLAPSPPPHDTLIPRWSGLLGTWLSRPSTLSQHTNSPVVDNASYDLFVDADARLSRRLWLLLLAAHVPLPSTPDKQLAFLVKLDTEQTLRHGGEGAGDGTDFLVHRALKVLAEAVEALCKSVIAGQRESDKTGGELLEIAETVVGESSRLAIELLASERMLLTCVLQTWQDISRPS